MQMIEFYEKYEVLVTLENTKGVPSQELIKAQQDKQELFAQFDAMQHDGEMATVFSHCKDENSAQSLYSLLCEGMIFELKWLIVTPKPRLDNEQDAHRVASFLQKNTRKILS